MLQIKSKKPIKVIIPLPSPYLEVGGCNETAMKVVDDSLVQGKSHSSTFIIHSLSFTAHSLIPKQFHSPYLSDPLTFH